MCPEMKRKVARESILTAGICLMLAVCASELKAAPANDDCSAAITLTTGVPYNGKTVVATGSFESTCGFLDTLDVWHRFTPATTGPILVSLCSSSFDTTLAILDGCSGTELECNDDSCGFQSEVTVTVIMISMP